MLALLILKQCALLSLSKDEVLKFKLNIMWLGCNAFQVMYNCFETYQQNFRAVSPSCCL